MGSPSGKDIDCHGRCLETFKDGDLVIETDFAEKYTHQSVVSMMMPIYPQMTLMVAIVRFSPQTHSGGGRVHVTETWIFASEDMKHDWDFHLHGLARMADYYLHGKGSEATAVARNDGHTPRIHMFTDGCGKQYKGRRNFRFLADSVRQIGFFIDHHFAATSHFKGCHDGIGGVAKNAMRRRERYGFRIMGADGVVSFLRSFFFERAGGEAGGEGEMRNYLRGSLRTASGRRMWSSSVRRRSTDPTRNWRVSMALGRCTTLRGQTRRSSTRQPRRRHWKTTSWSW